MGQREDVPGTRVTHRQSIRKALAREKGLLSQVVSVWEIAPDELSRAFGQRVAPSFMGENRARETDDPHRVRQSPFAKQAVQGRYQLATGQVAGRPEYHDRV